ncbi:MAG: hypothetical protein AAGA56_09290, partial [Myxococcota bacterium]
TLGVEAGIGWGDLGPLRRVRFALGGGYFVSGDERIERTGEPLPVGTEFFPEDRGGHLALSASAELVERPQFALLAYVRGTLPIGVELAKYTNTRIHYALGGVRIGAHLNDRRDFIRLSTRTFIELGSGAYTDGDGQHNAQLRLLPLLDLDFQRWLLPFRAGLGVGPSLEFDINDHDNPAYQPVYDAAGPRLFDAVRSTRLGIHAAPYFFFWRWGQLRLAIDSALAGRHIRATQRLFGELRVAF